MGQTMTKLSTLKDSFRRPKTEPPDITTVFSESVSLACSRTQECLLFQDPERKFWPSRTALSEIFLMTYITRSLDLGMPRTFSCTAMTAQQRALLGVDWVWAVVEPPSMNPQVQVAVQVLHQPGRESEDQDPDGGFAEAAEVSNIESPGKTMLDKMVDFCSSIGQDCYALFLFFGRGDDPGDICGVLSNNFHELSSRGGSKINRAFIEGFFKGSRYFSSSAAMFNTVIQSRQEGPLTMLIKF